MGVTKCLKEGCSSVTVSNFMLLLRYFIAHLTECKMEPVCIAMVSLL